MPKHASHATLERERTLSRIVADDEPVSPAALEECFGVLPLGDADFEMLDIVGVSDADELSIWTSPTSSKSAAPQLCRRRRSWRRQRIRQRRRRGWSRRR
jgi:hypothetical protein